MYIAKSEFHGTPEEFGRLAEEVRKSFLTSQTLGSVQDQPAAGSTVNRSFTNKVERVLQDVTPNARAWVVAIAQGAQYDGFVAFNDLVRLTNVSDGRLFGPWSYSLNNACERAGIPPLARAGWVINHGTKEWAWHMSIEHAKIVLEATERMASAS